MIFVTPFNGTTKETTGPSTDSGFDSLEEVVGTLGEDYILRTDGLLIYGGETDRVLFSKVVFRIDEVGNTG